MLGCHLSLNQTGDTHENQCRNTDQYPIDREAVERPKADRPEQESNHVRASEDVDSQGHCTAGEGAMIFYDPDITLPRVGTNIAIVSLCGDGLYVDEGVVCYESDDFLIKEQAKYPDGYDLEFADNGDVYYMDGSVRELYCPE